MYQAKYCNTTIFSVVWFLTENFMGCLLWIQCTDSFPISNLTSGQIFLELVFFSVESFFYCSTIYFMQKINYGHDILQILLLKTHFLFIRSGVLSEFSQKPKLKPDFTFNKKWRFLISIMPFLICMYRKNGVT